MKLQMKKGFALTGAALLLALSACSAASTSSTSSASASVSASSQASLAYDSSVSTGHTEFFVRDNGDGTKVIKDYTGKEITIPTKVERLANAWHANNQVVVLLGGGPNLVATTEYVKTIPWMKQVFPGIENVAAPVKTDNSLNMEELIAAKPDVVLVSNTKQREAVENAGLVGVQIGGWSDLSGVQKGISLAAEVLGTQGAYDRSVQYNKYQQHNIDLIKDRLEDLPESAKPKVLHIGTGTKVKNVTGSGVIIDEWIKLAGGINAASSVNGMKDVSMEQIQSFAPDIIIIGGDTSEQGLETITSDPTWADIPAVKNHRVIRNPYGTFNWDRYSAEGALQVLWAAQLLHPDKFTDINMVKETRDFYKTYYGYDLTEDEAKLILAGDPPTKK